MLEILPRKIEKFNGDVYFLGTLGYTSQLAS